MRHLSNLTMLVLFLAISGAASAVDLPSDKEATLEPKALEQVAPTTKTPITPHRAIYDMSLSSVKNGSNISGVSGQMFFEWADACDGWAVQQRLKLHFSYAEGDESNVTSNEATWESKDGKHYNFNIRRVTDDKQDENYRGRATLAADGTGVATYSTPEGRVTKLPVGTMFPSAHTEMILKNAKADEKLFSRRVFDGSDEDGSEDVSVFIDPAQAHWLETEVNPKLKTSPLLDQTSWPVRMAFFKINTETGEPDYEMDLNLLANGIARSMRIDYGDFSVLGTLVAIEPLPAHCN